MVRIYSLKTCPYCTELKELLTKEGIEFQDIDVDLPEHQAEYKKLYEFTKNDSVPIIKIGRNILVPEISFQSINEAVTITKKLII